MAPASTSSRLPWPALRRKTRVPDLAVLLRRGGDEAHVPVQMGPDGGKPRGAAQHGGDLGVVPAGVGRPGDGVGEGVPGGHHRVQLPHDGHGGFSAAPQPPLHPGQGGEGHLRQPQPDEGLPDQGGGVLLPVPQLRAAEDGLSGGDDPLPLPVDGGAGRLFDALTVHCVALPVWVSPWFPPRPPGAAPAAGPFSDSIPQDPLRHNPAGGPARPLRPVLRFL